MVNAQSTSLGVRISLDRGGTFTDVYASIPAVSFTQPPPHLRSDAVIILPSEDEQEGVVQIQLKLLSVDPQNYADAPAEGIRRIMQIVRGKEIPKGQKIDTSGVDSVRMGTTVATNVSFRSEKRNSSCDVGCSTRMACKSGPP